MSEAWRARRTPPFGPGTDSSTPARVSAWRCLARYGPGTPWNSASRLAGRQTPAGIAARRVQQWTVHSTPSDSRISRILDIPDILSTQRCARHPSTLVRPAIPRRVSSPRDRRTPDCSDRCLVPVPEAFDRCRGGPVGESGFEGTFGEPVAENERRHEPHRISCGGCGQALTTRVPVGPVPIGPVERDDEAQRVVAVHDRMDGLVCGCAWWDHSLIANKACHWGSAVGATCAKTSVSVLVSTTASLTPRGVDEGGLVVDGGLEPGVDNGPYERGLQSRFVMDLRRTCDEVAHHRVVRVWPRRVGLDA